MNKSARQSGGASDNAAARGAIDSLVQGSLVELFHAYGVAVAPLPRIKLSPGQAATIPDVSAVIAFTRQGGRSGRMSLSLPGSVLELTRATGPSAAKADWARELANQLMGRIKNRMLQFAVRLDVGSLTSIDSKLLSTQLEKSTNTRMYAGRTLRGEVVVTLDGVPEESELTYVGAVAVASEGDLILF